MGKFNAIIENKYIQLGFVFFVTATSYMSTVGKYGIADTVDGIGYIMMGIKLLEQAQPNLYPSYPLQVISSTISGYFMNGSVLISNISLLSGICFFITNFTVFKIAKQFLNTHYTYITLLILNFLFFLNRYEHGDLYAFTAIRPLTDVWLLMFFYLTVYFYLKDKFILSVATAVLAFLFRQQAMIIVPCIILLKPFHWRRCAILLSAPIISNYIFNNILYSITNFSVEGNFYFNTFMSKINSERLFDFKTSLHYLISVRALAVVVYMLICVGAFYIFSTVTKITSGLKKEEKRFFLFNVSALLILYLISAHGIYVTHNFIFDPRYFIYIIPASFISFFICIEKFQSCFSNKYIIIGYKGAITLFSIYAILLTAHFKLPNSYDAWLSKLTQIDYHKNDYIQNNVTKDDKILVVTKFYNRKACLAVMATSKNTNTTIEVTDQPVAKNVYQDYDFIVFDRNEQPDLYNKFHPTEDMEVYNNIFIVKIETMP